MLQQLTSENFSEFRQIFSQLDTDNSGFITVKKLAKAMEKMGFEISKEEIKQIIQSMDRYMNGYINYSSFLAATVNLKERLSETLLQETFSYFDNSGMGCIS